MLQSAFAEAPGLVITAGAMRYLVLLVNNFFKPAALSIKACIFRVSIEESLKLSVFVGVRHER